MDGRADDAFRPIDKGEEFKVDLEKPLDRGPYGKLSLARSLEVKVFFLKCLLIATGKQFHGTPMGQ